MGNNWKKVQKLSLSQVVTLLNIVVPLVSGAVLAAFSLAQKHFNAQRYIFAYWPAWVYLIFSSLGSLLMTKVMQTVGTRVLQDDLLNAILQGMLGAAIFLGIVTKVPLAKSSDGDINESIKTIRDFFI